LIKQLTPVIILIQSASHFMEFKVPYFLEYKPDLIQAGPRI